MAIKKPRPAKATPQIRDYWRRYHRTANIITILMQLTISLVVGLALLVGGVTPDSRAFWMTMLATTVTGTALNYLLVSFLLTPLRDVAMAVTSAVGQDPTDPPANPNIPRYTKDGFQPLLQYLYEQASGDNVPATAAAGDDIGGSVKQLHAALNETSAGLIIMSPSGEIQYFNKSAPVVEGTDGKPKLELLFENDNVLENWLANCRETAVHAEQMWVRVPNKIVGEDDRRIFNVSGNYEKGSAAEVVLVTHDTTGIFQPEDDELDFISFAAHELRGPITVIRGYLDVLQNELQGNLAADQQELFQRLIVSANRLSGYINNILNTSKYDRRHLKINLTEDSLASIYASIRDDMELRAASQHRLLSVDLPTSLPTVAADRSSLSEVISNLIDNALKYSNEGGAVAVTAAVEGDFVKVSVTDNGIGMPSNVVGNLFHKFYRSHRSRETIAGTGIGLYICKAIIESHGGKIGVNSTEGVGSTFTFTVPTYASVAGQLQANDFSNTGLITTSDGWIKNHSKFTG